MKLGALLCSCLLPNILRPLAFSKESADQALADLSAVPAECVTGYLLATSAMLFVQVL
jgi:hypothetical protein